MTQIPRLPRRNRLAAAVRARADGAASRNLPRDLDPQALMVSPVQLTLERPPRPVPATLPAIPLVPRSRREHRAAAGTQPRRPRPAWMVADRSPPLRTFHRTPPLPARFRLERAAARAHAQSHVASSDYGL